MKTLRPVYVLGGQRLPFAKSWTNYTHTTNQELMTAAVDAVVKKYKLAGERIGDVALGSVNMSPMDWNMAREVVLGTDLDPGTPGYNVQRACGTSLETTAQLWHKIAFGEIDSGIAGGSDTNSDLPVAAQRSLSWKLLDLRNARTFGERLKVAAELRPADFKPAFPAVVEPRTGKSMGQHCELMVQEWKISREAQDELALASHKTGAQAYQEGFYDDLVVPFGKVKKDTIVRADTSIEKLAKLKPAFERSAKGTLTAGNSSPLTDGASAVLLGSEDFAKRRGLEPLARLVDFESAALDFVKGEGLLMAPTIAVARMLKRNNLKLQDFDYYEIHEAFAGQVLCTLKAWETDEYMKRHTGMGALGSIDRSKMNLKGGSVALGHPFAATGTRIVASLSKMLAAKPKSRGLISICTAGGMGVAAILESAR